MLQVAWLVGMAMIDPHTIRWPSPWKPVTDEHAALAFGRAMNEAVAPSIVGELHREICTAHPLFGVECRPVAYDAKVRKDFLLETDRLEMPFVMVHFTWTIEKDPRWPFIIRFQNIDEFLKWACEQPDHGPNLSIYQRIMRKLSGDKA